MRFLLPLFAATALFAGGAPGLQINPAENPLPPDILAFPEFSENYRQKILSGDFEIWSEDKLQRWSSAQGLAVTEDHAGAGLKYRRAAIIAAPGIKFTLTRPVTEKGSEFANGWKLTLDVAAIRPREGLTPKKSGQYFNILECDVYIDGVFYKKLKQGAQTLVASPVEIQIPHIRSGEGKVTVELKLANHPRNFLFLYDAYLSR